MASSLSPSPSPPLSPPTQRPPASYYRISRLPPPPSIPRAGPSGSKQRYLYFAVRQGYNPGVYTNWHEAERQIVNYPEPVVKTFSTKLAAEAYVSGWDGAGRHSLPSSTPRPLREHLAMSFPGSVNAHASPSSSLSSAPRRQSYHARLLASAPGTDFAPSPLDTSPAGLSPTARPGMSTRGSYRHSMVRISSPLRQEVDESEEESTDGSGVVAGRQTLRKAASFMGAGGLLSPPQSPEKETRRLSVSTVSTVGSARPALKKGVTDPGMWRAPAPGQSALGMGVARPLSPPPAAPVPTRRASVQAPSGLWADVLPPPPTSAPATPAAAPEPDCADPSAPKFSRSGLKKSGVVMPVAAKRSSSSLSLKSRGSSLFSTPNGSSSSLASSTSGHSDRTLRSSSHGSHASHSRSLSSSSSASSRRTSTSHSRFPLQDRLASLTETSQRELRELQLNDEGLAALSSLPPPRPAFMMRRVSSNSSIGSTDSAGSMGSMTSNASTQTSMDSCGPITEEGEVEPSGMRICEEPESYSNGEGDAGVDADGMTEIDLGCPTPLAGPSSAPYSSTRIPCPIPTSSANHALTPTVTRAKSGSISCTKSDGDASIDGGSMRKKKVGGGGMMRRLAKALKLGDKKGGDGRRGSM
ncbi:hypothetical protein IAT38_002019 [Cryptococcus sp. DSM 104549]